MVRGWQVETTASRSSAGSVHWLDQSTIPQPQQDAQRPAEPTAELPQFDRTADDATEPQTERFKVVGIVDGDTIDVLTHDKRTIRLRLNGIDTPERGQPFGNNATKYLSQSAAEMLMD